MTYHREGQFPQERSSQYLAANGITFGCKVELPERQDANWMQTGCKLAAFANLGNRELHVAAFKGFILAANRSLVTAHAEWAAIGLHLGFLSSGGCSGSDELLEK